MSDQDELRAERTRTIVRTLTGYMSLGPDVRRLVERNLAKLTEREQQVIRLRFGYDRTSARSKEGRSSSLRTLQEVGDQLGIARGRARQIEARAISKLSHPDMDWPDTAAVDWRRTAEVLLLRVETLVVQSDALQRQLAEALREERLARSRVRHLEDLVAMLRRELYETGGKPSQRWVGSIATLTLGLVGGFLGGIGEAGGGELLNDLRDAQDAAVIVMQDCGVEGTDAGGIVIVDERTSGSDDVRG